MYDVLYVVGAWFSPTAVCVIWMIWADRAYRRSLEAIRARLSIARAETATVLEGLRRQSAYRVKAEDRYAFLVKRAYLRDDKGRIRKASEIL